MIGTKTELTDREKEVLAYIIRFKEVNQYSPTIDEIARGICTKSTTHVRYMLNQMRLKGVIDFVDKSPRTLKVLKFN